MTSQSSQNHRKNKNIISLKNVGKTFVTEERSFAALDSISISINKGEYLAIVGKSGSGKSTLLNMITGIDFPTQGTIEINETKLGAMKEAELARWRGKNIGIVFQFFQLIPTLPISENLFLALEFVNVIPKKDREARVKELLTQVDIFKHANKMPAALSGGEQQRAAIARALVNDPDIIIADEPTGNLDKKTTTHINNLFKSLADAGKTIIIVTHEDNSKFTYDRVITLSDGKVVSSEATAKTKLSGSE